MRNLLRLFVLLLLMAPAPALAAVEIAFYSKDADVRFPHAFIVVRGTVDSTGEVVDEDYGFTAEQVSPAVLWGPIRGEIISNHPGRYIAASNRHFAFVLSDAEYFMVMDLVERWRALPQPSYRLDDRNCLFFVAEAAALLGLEATPPPDLVRKPNSFLTWVARRNRDLIARRQAGAVTRAEVSGASDSRSEPAGPAPGAGR